MALITNEIPTGTINGINKVFTLSQPIAQIVLTTVDGATYLGTVVILGNQITLGDAPTVSLNVTYYNTTPPSVSTGTTFSNLLLLLASKLANRSTVFYTNADRAQALNWARTQMSHFNFPELVQTVSLSFSPTVLNGINVAVATEPAGLNRYIKLWDITAPQQEYAYLEPTDFDIGGPGNTFTREITGGIRYTYVLPITTTSLNARYAQAISLFTTNGNVQNEFDPHYDDLIIDGAINWLSLKGRDFNDLAVFQQSFQSQIAQVFQNNVEQGGTASHPRFIFYGEKFDILNP